MHENKKINEVFEYPLSNEKINLPIFETNNIEVDILRLDKIHPIISGNKLFKLSGYHLSPAQTKKILTFGGAWSNHIVATAYTAHIAGLRATGIIRGERPAQFSQTLQDAETYGMQLEFVSREHYRQISGPNAIPQLERQYPDTIIIPEGGAGPQGIEGAKKILTLTDTTKYTHIACPIGTGTTFQGILAAAQPHQTIIGVPVLKGFTQPDTTRTVYLKDYHFGGYARHTPELIQFMNDFYKMTGIPTDFVYTAKLVYAIMNEIAGPGMPLTAPTPREANRYAPIQREPPREPSREPIPHNTAVQKDFFPPHPRILLIHTGGLQGNRSLPPGVLYF